jgi:hypothetical protein
MKNRNASRWRRQQILKMYRNFYNENPGGLGNITQFKFKKMKFPVQIQLLNTAKILVRSYE